MGKIKKLLAEYFKTNRNVLAVYVFGSRANGKSRPDSDADVAIVLSKTAEKRSFDFQMKWKRELSCFFGKEIDLVILNEADPFLKFQVYSKGILVTARDERLAEDLKWRAVKEYWDWIPCQRILEASVMDRIKQYD
ncbi:MAG: nucleotidyltransferase domain-containing protein [Elusimicrobia bacterium]|nr:nucleotidyltransferase domain-containing protein [Elusimicrobiota bacterium]